MTVEQITRARPHLRLTFTGAALAAVPSAAVALAVWVVAVPLAGVDLVVGSGAAEREVGAFAVAFAAVVATWAAYGVRAALWRSRLPRRTWRVLALAVLVVSLLGPAGAASSAAFVALAAMHLGVGAVIIGIEVAATRAADGR